MTTKSVQDFKFAHFEISARFEDKEQALAHLPQLGARLIREHKQQHGEELEYVGADVTCKEYGRTVLVDGRLKFRVKETV